MSRLISTDKKEGNKDLIVGIALFLVILLSAFLRVYHLQSTPGWWPDEGVDLNISTNLLHGRAQMFAYSYPFNPHPPLYYLLNVPFIAVLGSEIVSLRFVSSLYGIITTLLVFYLGKSLFDKKAGLSAALLYCLYSVVIINARTGLSYILLGLLFTLLATLIVRFEKTNQDKYLFWAGLVGGLASTTSYFGVVAIFFVLLYTIFKKRSLIFHMILFSIGPFLVYLILALRLDGAAFLHDLDYMLSRPETTISMQDVARSYASIFNPLKRLDAIVLLLGLFGLLFAQVRRAALWLVFLFFIISFFEFKFRGNWWYLQTFSSLLVVGAGIFASRISNETTKHLKISPVYVLPVIVAILACLMYPQTQKLVSSISRGSFAGLDYEEGFSPKSFQDLQTTADYINANTTKNDLVMRSSHISHLFHALHTDPLLAYVYQDKSSINFPDDMRITGRFLYNASLEETKYFVEDSFARNWFIHQPGLKQGVFEKIFASWPVIFEQGEFKVYANPKLNTITKE